MQHIDYPYGFDHRGRTARTSDEDHVRDMIEQVLFTSPGERVNRPDFGSGLLQLVFDPNSPELSEAVRYTVQAALDRWLGDLIVIEQLEVTSVESTLRLVLDYALRSTGERRSATFERSL
jgi:phage baseplate assembly protein W